MDHLAELLQQDPYAQDRMNQIEQFTQQFAAGACEARKSIIRIPVVFHILHNNSTENISDARIHEQLEVLNEDFGRYNADASNTPSAFAGVATDTEIQFCLATRDPICGTTTGILRKYTDSTQFVLKPSVKHNGTGGDDAWPSTDYLNIWVCDLRPGLLGYGTFPGTASAGEDGVVLDYASVGGPSAPGTWTPFHLGRTGTHEVGHWLNLRHIWGDAFCGDDFVGDTPTQQGSNSGCPSFPSVTCSNGPNGDMFMNYMDYSDDACYNMFTIGQSVRMHACLESARASLYSSLGCSPGQTAVDLYVRDSPEDVGNEPNTQTGSVIWDSNDIWVRNSNDGVPTHQNPKYGQTNYVYVRVLNKGCTSSTGTEKLSLYWTKASPVGPWPGAWNGTQTFSCGSNPSKGNQIGSAMSIPVIASSGSTTLVFSWNPPNPANYSCLGLSAWDQIHFCLLARITTSSVYPYGMTTGEGSDVGSNARNNNNIAWKNLQIDPPTIATVVASNEDVPARFNLIYAVPDNEMANPITENGHITIELGEELYRKWEEGGFQGRGVENDPTRPYTVQVNGPHAVLENLLFEPEDYVVPVFRITFDVQHNGPRCIFLYHVIMQNYVSHAIVGGVTYEIHKPVCVLPDAGPDITTCAGCLTELAVRGQVEQDASYEWRDLRTGQIVGVGPSVVVAPMMTTTYELKAALESGCVDVDQVTVNVGGVIGKNDFDPKQDMALEALPNPFGSLTRIRFSLPDACAAQLDVTDELGRKVATLFDGNAQAGKVYDMEFKPKGLGKGIYFARLTACGHETRFIKLIYLE